MSEATQTAVESGASAAAPAQPAAPADPITSERISEMREKRDVEGIRKIIAEATSLGSDTIVPREKSVPGTAPAQPAKESPAASAQPTAVKKFKDKFHGQEFELDDSDGFLGRKDLSTLKQENAHQRLYVTEVEKREKEAKLLADQYFREAAELKRQADDYKAKLEAATKAAPVAPAQPATEAKPEPKPELPKSPKKPATNFDPLDEASQAEWQKYFDDSAIYTEQVQGYLQNLKPEIRNEIPQEFKSEVEQLRNKVNKYEQHFSTVEENTRKSAVEDAMAKQWNTRAEFQNTHKDFSTTKPLKQIDKELLGWSVRLAALNGLNEPGKPYNTQDSDWANYESSRRDLILKYAAGDQKVVESAGTFTPPDEYEKYLAVFDLENKRQKMISEGVLGPKATLHDAFVKDFDASGKMAETLGAVEKENILRGANGVKNALESVKRDYATQLPEDIGGKGKSDASDISKLSIEERDRILGATTAEQIADPSLRLKKLQIIKSLSLST